MRLSMFGMIYLRPGAGILSDSSGDATPRAGSL